MVDSLRIRIASRLGKRRGAQSRIKNKMRVSRNRLSLPLAFRSIADPTSQKNNKKKRKEYIPVTARKVNRLVVSIDQPGDGYVTAMTTLRRVIFAGRAVARRNPVDGGLRNAYRVTFASSFVSLSMPRRFSRYSTACSCHLLKPDLWPVRFPTTIPRRSQFDRRIYNLWELRVYVWFDLVHNHGCDIPSTKKNERENAHRSPPLSPRRFLFCSPFALLFFLFSTSFSAHGACHDSSVITEWL